MKSKLWFLHSRYSSVAKRHVWSNIIGIAFENGYIFLLRFDIHQHFVVPAIDASNTVALSVVIFYCRNKIFPKPHRSLYLTVAKLRSIICVSFPLSFHFSLFLLLFLIYFSIHHFHFPFHTIFSRGIPAGLYVRLSLVKTIACFCWWFSIWLNLALFQFESP